jgi:hypothetical protein
MRHLGGLEMKFNETYWLKEQFQPIIIPICVSRTSIEDKQNNDEGSDD